MLVVECFCSDGVATTSPPTSQRAELWIAMSLVLLIVILSLFGLVLVLHFRRTHRKLNNAEDHDGTMLKVPNGEDPTYGVRGIGCMMRRLKHCMTNLDLISVCPLSVPILGDL